MKHRLILCIPVFISVFLLGSSVVYLQQKQSRHEIEKSTAKKKFAPSSRETGSAMPPLSFPRDVTVAPGSDDGWEYIGNIPWNYVTARTKMCSFFQRQNWKQNGKIQLDESLNPMELLTFRQREYELLLQIWRIDTNTTGFSCRRTVAENK